MKRNKKLLVSFLALNAILSAYTLGATDPVSPKYEKIYNNIVKNMERGKSNDKNYQIIERILKQRNKELKDLYLQGDYIVKPEYLEWQVFLTGFYEEYNEGVDNSKENARYHSQISGYYDTNGNYISTGGLTGGLAGKPYQPLQQVKDINLGVSIPLKGMTRDALNLSLTPAGETNAAPVTANITPPVPTFNGGIISLSPFSLPSAPIVTVVPPSLTIPIFSFPATGNGDDMWISSTGGVAPIAQINLNNDGLGTPTGTIGTMNVNVSGSNFDVSMSNVQAVGVQTSAHALTTNPSGYVPATGINYTGLSQVAVMKLVGGHDVYVDNLNINFGGTGVVSIPKMLFHIDAHNNYGSSVYHVGNSVTTNIDGSNLLFFGIQYHSGGTGLQDAGMIHNGTITTSSTSSNITIFATIASAGGTNTRDLYFTNNGKITLNGTNELLGLIDLTGATGRGGVFTNNNIIEMNGTNSIGLIVNTTATGLPRIILNSPININGTGNTGIVLQKDFDWTQSIFKFKLDGVNGIGLYSTYTPGIQRVLSNYEMSTDINANHSTLVYVTGGNFLFDNTGIISLNGTDNNGIALSGSNASASIDNDITSVGDGNVVLYSENSSNLQYAGIIETDGIASHGVVVGVNGNITNYSGNSVSVETKGNSSVALYNAGTLNLLNGGTYKATGDKSSIIYNASGPTNIIGANTYEVGTNGVGFYVGGGSLTLDSNTGTSTIKIGSGSVFSSVSSAGFLTFTNGVFNIQLDADAIGFVYTGTGFGTVTASSISSYLGSYYSGLGNLYFTLDPTARLFVIENYGNILLSDVQTLSTSGSVVNIIGSSGKDAYLWKGSLTVDSSYGTINLDNSSNILNNVDRSAVGVTLDPGVTLVGTQTNQVGLADIDIYTGGYVNMNNNGMINLSGSGSVGIYTNNGTITNNGQTATTGLNSIALYGENSTTITNNAGGIVTIGDAGIGIYGVSYQNPASPPAYGTGTINIINNGTITAVTGTNAIGIYAENNKPGGTIADASINLGSGTVDVSSSENGVGVYVNTGTVADTGSTITVGKNGVAFYAKDSNVTLAGTTINLYGDNSLGLYLDGNTNFSGTGTINISGQNVVLFNMVSSGTVSNNFNVGSVAAGSTYTLGNIAGGVFEYTGNSVLASNGTLVSGTASAIYLNGSTITAAAGAANVAAVALDGQYTGALPAGMTPGTDGENNGTIVLGDTSVGIYGKNGSRISNKGLITIGDSSAGLMTSGAGSFVLNSGTINIGTGSQGMYLKDGVNALNAGSIISSGTGSVGIMVNSSTGLVMPVTNSGIIDLSGDKSIGIYSTGTDAFNITNNAGALIQIGNSSNASDPGIGIYSAIAGSTVTNSGTVTSGINSIGIYNSGGIVNNNGISNVDDAGVGIYSTGGIVNLNAGSALNLGTNGAVGVYGVYSTVTNSTNLNMGNSNYGFILKGGSFTNGPGTNSSIGTDSVYMYSTEGTTVINDGILTMTGSDNVGFYMAQDPASGLGGASFTNNGTIIGTAGSNNIGIYNYGGTVDNHGTVSVGSSTIVFEPGTTDVDVLNSIYSVGIYGENSNITNHSTATVSAGYGGYGIVAKGGSASNYGTVQTTGDYSTGMYTEGGIITNESTGIINVTGDNAIGMAGKGTGSQIINNGIINITGNDAIGMYGNIGTIITNNGTITINGSGQLMVSSDPTNSSHNVSSGTAMLNGSVNNTIQALGSVHTLPTLINAGIIKTNGVLALDGIQILIKPDPSTVQASSDPAYDFELSGTSIIADQITTSTPIVILPGFSDGTIANVYKLENVIQASAGTYDFISGSLLWEATPQATGTGADIYMSRKAFTDFTDGLWFEDFGTALENNYLTATGDGMTIYNKTAYITDEPQFRHIMASMAGNVYSNINQRENDIAGAFENSLLTLQESTNNTKENVKISIIAGKGKNKEVTDGVTGYDYTTTGALALREVERTYKHTFGYSLGYLHTGFEFNDGNNSEEWVDTIQLGVHNKYRMNDWELRNNLTGRVSFHNVDRNIEWGDTLGRSEMNGTYETYSITSDNIIGKEFKLGKKAGIMPYGAFRAMYVTRPTFSESGLERLEVEGNDAWSVKPRAGVELNGALPLGTKTAWQLKGTLDLAYEYELADLNEREKAKLIAIEDGYHKLSKPEDEKGTFRTKAAIGVEVADRYGIFLTGEYSTGNDKEDDYRAGVSLKAIF